MRYIDRIKTGIRGVGDVRYDDAVAWPDSLKSNIAIPKNEPVRLPSRKPRSRENVTIPGGLAHVSLRAADIFDAQHD